MTPLDFIEALNFTVLHTVLCLLGFGLCLVVMQLWSTGQLAIEPLPIMWLRRCSLGMLALSFLWSLAYLKQQGWIPHPAHTMMVLAVDLGLLCTALTAWNRWQHEKIKNGPPVLS